MTNLIRILYVDDYPLDRQLVRDALEKEHGGFQVTEAASRAAFEAALANGSFDIVLSDFNILGFEGLQVLEAVHSRDARIPVVIVTGTGSEEVAVEAMKRGAADYVIKTPKHIQRLPLTIHAVLEKKYLEEEGKRAEERFLTIYENAVEGIYQSTLDGRYLNVNPATAHIYGYDSPQDMMAQVIDIRSQIYVHSQDRADFIQLLTENGKVENFEVQNYRKDRSIIWIQTNARLVQAGKESFIEGFITDITKGRQAEDALRDSEARLRTVVEASPMPLTINSTEEDIILYGNSALSRMMEVPLSEIVGQRAANYYADSDERARVLAEFKQHGSLHDYEVRLRRPDGALVWVSLSTEAITFDGKPCLLSCFYDITERKQAEALQDALYQISEAANKAADLDELFEAVHATIGRVMQAHNFYIALYDAESDLISFPYYVDEMDRFTSPSILAARPGRGMTEYVIRTGKPLLSDIANFEELARRGEVELVGPPSPIWIGAPLIIDGRTIGVIAMQDYNDPNVYTDRELKILEYVSGQVAKAIERTQLYSDIRWRNQILSALQESTLVLMGRVRLKDVLQAIVTQILQLMNTLNGFLYLVEPDGKNLKMRVGLGINSRSVDLMLELGEGLAGKIWETHQPLVVQDYPNWEGRSRRFDEFGIRAMVGVPLLSGSETIGVLGVQYIDDSGTISAQDVELLTRFAQLASIALENAQYYQAARDELKDRIRAEAALVEAEAKYRALVERLPVVVYTSELGRAGAWHYVSPQIDSLLGFTPEEWMGDPNLWYQQIHPDDRERQEALEERSYARGEPFEGEYRIFTRDGREIWIRDAAQILPPREGELPIVQGVLVDITERKQAEREMTLLSQAIKSMRESMVITDENNNILFVNHASQKTYGYESHELIGRHISIVQSNKNPPALLEKLTTATSDGTWEGELINKRKDGSEFPIHLSSSSVVDEMGKIIALIGVAQDITERKQAEDAMRQSEEKYRNLIEAMSDGLGVQDKNGLITFMNRRACEMLGYELEELIGKPVTFLFDEKNQKILQEQMIQLRKGGQQSFEVSWLRKEGGKIDTIIAPRPRFDEKGEFVESVAVFTDITDRKRTEEKIKRQLDHLKALRMIDMTITASADLHLSLQTILRQTVSQLQVDATDILLLNPTTHLLEYSDGMGFFTRGVERSSVRIGEGLAGRAVLERKMVSIHALYENNESLTRKTLLDGENFTDYYGVPLIAKGEVKGVLEVFQRTHMEADQEWEDFLEALAGQAGLAIDNATLFQNLQRSNLELGMAYESTLEGWSAALDLRDKETEGHTLRVTNLTLRLAKHMGLSDKDLMQIRRGALLHDIGKMGVPDRILLKPDNLTTEEWEIMQRHPVYAQELLSRIEYLRPALSIPYCHHEKWNGTGYPRGLKGEEIPLDARVFSVVDVYDALVSDRPYRPAWTKEKALEYIRSLSGIDFDPRVVTGFLELLTQN
jgi:PAS domain S-box-containing protein/putative nucleotidyltransferase with HDIG domain